MADSKHDVGGEVSGPRLKRLSVFGLPVDLFALLAVPPMGVAVAMLLPVIRVLRDAFR